MPDNDLAQPPGSRPAGADRLDGWKAIAAFLNRAVRTAQRWEKEAGLPVRRVGPSGGESVFAFRDELDAWLRSSAGVMAQGAADTAGGNDGNGGHGGNGANRANGYNSGNGQPPGPGRVGPAEPGLYAGSNGIASGRASGWRARRAATWVSVVVLSAAAVVALATWRQWTSLSAPEPAGWELQGEDIVILDTQGAVLRRELLGFRCDSDQNDCTSRAAVDDFDGDGHREVVIAREGDDPRLSCGDGLGERAAVRVTRTRQYGDGQYGPPFVFNGVVVERTPAGERQVLAWGRHYMYYPSFVLRVRIGPGCAMEVLGEYWHPGHVSAVAAAEFNGRRTVLIGGSHNEDGMRGGHVTVFFDGRLSGSGPVVSDRKRCLDCGPDTPDLVFLLPRSPVAEAIDPELTVGPVRFAGVSASGFTTEVTVANTLPLGGALFSAVARYSFDGELRVTRTELTGHDGVAALWARHGHPTRPWTSSDLWPVGLWRHGRFEPAPKSIPD